MSNEGNFRTPEQEVVKLLEECSELKRILKDISAQVGRMETRLKRAFPAIASSLPAKSVSREKARETALTSEQALAEFDRIVQLVASGERIEAERLLEARSVSDLLVIARELGVTFSKSRPSLRTVREAIFGKVRESILLSRHTSRN